MFRQGPTFSTSPLVITTSDPTVYRADMSRASVSPITNIQRAHRLFSRPPVYNAGSNAMHAHTQNTGIHKACKVATLPLTSGISHAPIGHLKCER